jgi:hypothetical protein
VLGFICALFACLLACCGFGCGFGLDSGLELELEKAELELIVTRVPFFWNQIQNTADDRPTDLTGGERGNDKSNEKCDNTCNSVCGHCPVIFGVLQG